MMCLFLAFVVYKAYQFIHSDHILFSTRMLQSDVLNFDAFGQCFQFFLVM